MSSSGRWLRRAGAAVGAIVAAAATYFEQVAQTANLFRRLIPLGAEGWAISTYGMMLAPDAHAAAADHSEGLDQASMVLEDCWSDAEIRRGICSLVPWVYPPEKRAIGWRRKELLERASDRFAEGLYEETVLLVYSQLDGLFQDRAADGEHAFARLFSRRPVNTQPGQAAREFIDIVADSGTMLATEQEFFLLVRDAMIESITETTVEDRPSRHGVLHGRVLGYGTRRRAAQSFAFLAACLEVLVASYERLPLSHYEAHEMPASDAHAGLQLILRAKAFSPVRSVYLHSQRTGHDVLLAVDQTESPDLLKGPDT